MKRRTYSAEMIVIKRRNHGEADRILTVFSRDDGKFTCLAKGVRKTTSKKRGHVELFTHIQGQLVGGYTWDILTEARTITGYPRLRKDLDRVATAFKLIEVVDRLLPEEEPHEEVFMWLEKAFAYLDEEMQPNLDSLYRSFCVKLLQYLGYWPESTTLPVNITSYIESLIERPLNADVFGKH